MERLIVENDLQLIKQYNNYYIRFRNLEVGSHDYQIGIDSQEAVAIQLNPESLSTVFKDKVKNKVLDENELMKRIITDYLKYLNKYSEQRIASIIKKLYSHIEIYQEFYQFIIDEKIPQNGVMIEGYNASYLYHNYKLTELGAYNYLIALKENLSEALEGLKKGLPKK